MEKFDLHHQNIKFLVARVKTLMSWAIDRFGSDLFMTSKFGVNVVLSEIIYDMSTKIPIYFIDIGFQFEETLEMKDIYNDMGFSIIETSSGIRRGDVMNEFGHDVCCQIN